MAYGYFALGTASGRQGFAAQSRQAFLHALELDPNYTSAMNNFTNEEIRRGRLDEAAYWARRSFVRSGKGPNDYFHLVGRRAKRSDSSARISRTCSMRRNWSSGSSR